MATPEQILFVRRNIGVTDLTDEQIGAYVDAYGTNCAIGSIWLEKASRYADMVDTSEAGASLKLSDLRKNAQAMADYWCPGGTGDGGDGGNGTVGIGVRIKQIVRDS
jgi:hypothetical protein